MYILVEVFIQLVCVSLLREIHLLQTPHRCFLFLVSSFFLYHRGRNYLVFSIREDGPAPVRKSRYPIYRRVLSRKSIPRGLRPRRSFTWNIRPRPLHSLIAPIEFVYIIQEWLLRIFMRVNVWFWSISQSLRAFNRVHVESRFKLAAVEKKKKLVKCEKIPGFIIRPKS